MVSLLVCCWNINRLKGHSSNADSSLQSNVDKLLHDRTKEIDEEVQSGNCAPRAGKRRNGW